MGPLKRVQEEIQKRSLHAGGWTSGSGRRAGIETTCYALMALYDRQALACDRAINLLLRTQNPDGSWSGDHCITGRTFCTSSALMVLMTDRAAKPVAREMRAAK